MHRKKASIRQQIRCFVFAVLLISGIAVGLCVTVTTYLKERNDIGMSRIATLSDYYKIVDEMDGYARIYLSEGGKENYAEYERRQRSARSDIQTIAAHLNEIRAYHVYLLENMLDTYDERLQLYLQMPQDWYAGYRSLEYTNQLIQNTAPEYYDMLIADTQERMAHDQEVWRIQLLLVGGLLLSLFLLSLGVSRHFTRTISQPITEMVNDIRSVQQGNYNIPLKNPGTEELAVLTQAFSRMAAILKANDELLRYNAELDRQLLEQENENLRVKNLLYQSELKNLQAQINPHFLFNTLNMIAKRAMLSGDRETSELMENTSALLRYSLDKSSKISTLREELSCIKSYFYIQQQRFEGRVRFRLNVEPGLPDIPMPAMVLQPIVENSIIHGIRDMTQDAEVTLKAHCFEGDLHIHIEDNGQGIPSEQLEVLQSSFRPGAHADEDDDSTHIGLRNVYRRLEMYYGTEMRFYIESERDCGTVVTLEIPLEAGGTA